MRKLSFLIIIVLFFSCKKNNTEFIFRGEWVEKTMRQDTVEFNSLLASSHQTLYFRAQTPMVIYFYQIKTDSILLKSSVSSGAFNPYYFNSSGTSEFTISNFFMRPGLPAIVQFVKIK